MVSVSNFVSLLATPFVLWLCIRQFIGDSLISIIASLFITLFYLNYQPNITEGVYWFIGISNYHLCNLFVLIQLTLLLKSFSASGRGKIFLQAASLLLLVVVVGFNEIGAMLIPCFYLCGAVFNRQSSMVNRQVLVVFTFVAIISSAFVFFSPGNFVRAHEFENRFDLLHSLLYSSAQTIRFLGQWMLNVPFVLLSLIVIVNADKVKSRTIDYRLLITALLFVVFVGSFLPYFATGVLGQHRTINFVFFSFILLWILFLLSVSERFLLHEKMNVLKNETVTAILLLVSVLVIVHSGNGYKIISDYHQDNFRKYETSFLQRQTEVLRNPGAPIRKLSVIPNTFQVVDVREDSTWWVDKCMKKYYLSKVALK